MTTRLYKRGMALTLSRSQRDRYFVTTETTVVTDQHVSFEVEKHLGKTPNTARIKVYNSSQRSRAELQRRLTHVRLDVGYDGNLQRLCSGDLTWSYSRLDGTTWVSELEIGDGHRAYNHARIARSYKAGTNLKTLAADVAKSMGLELPKSAQQAKAMSAQFLSGVTLEGLSSREMSRLLNKAGLGWSVQDGRLQILGDGDYRNGEVPLIAQDAGMVGTPEYGPAKKPGKPPVLTAKTFLRPELTPGQRVRVQSLHIDGMFKLRRVRHVGDTHGPDWHTEIEATAL